MEYFNTVPESGDSLKDKELKAKTQSKIVLKLFRVHKSLSPSEAWQKLNLTDVPLTSIRSRITTLTDKNYLVRTNIKVKGLYNRKECVWSLIENF